MSFAVYPSLRGLTVLVSGGASGIGAAIVRAFCLQGARVAFADVDREAARSLCQQLDGQETTAPLFFECDLRDVDAVRGFVARAHDQLGAAAVLVNNAANDRRQNYTLLSPEEWDDSMAVNLRHYFFASQAVIPQMRTRGGGSIIHLGSIAWRLGDVGMPAYTCAKAAIEGLTKSMAREVGSHGIRVNCVAPGWVMTERQLRDHVTPDARNRIRQRQCLTREVVPEDIAQFVLFLGADDSRACTAQTYVVDAGWA